MAFKKVCFMVMPFGVKETGAVAPDPVKVDFDALWRDALQPALNDMGYLAVRADQDIGAMIIKEMLERLYFADLVVADISIPNANAYYEIGIRHAAKTEGCVLIAADWAKPVFDLGQIRRLTYPLPANFDETAVANIKKALAPVKKLAAGPTPMREAIENYPDVPKNRKKARALAEQWEEFARFQGRLAAVPALVPDDRPTAVAEIVEDYPAEKIELGLEAVEMVKLVRDAGGDWAKTLAYIQALPESLRELPWIREQEALALSKHGDHLKAIAALHELIDLAGDSSERQGLLGGRYKRLYNESVKKGKPERQHLNNAIKAYERGTLLDLHDYFPSCNLPALYRELPGKANEAKAVAIAAVARKACESALLRGTGDEWLRPTLLGLAFAERNPAAAEEIADLVEQEHAVGWKLETTLADLRRHVDQTQDPETKESLAAIVDRLNDLLSAG